MQRQRYTPWRRTGAALGTQLGFAAPQNGISLTLMFIISQPNVP